jgi:hypothetical protein
MRSQEDIGGAVAKYYGDAVGRQLTTLLKQHIGIAVDVVTAAKAGDKAGFKQAFDAVYDHILGMSDALADGIVKQSPEKFDKSENVTN